MRKMTASQACISLIKEFEGCKLTAYKPVPTEKYYTIGYGHYGPDVKQGTTITESQAEELFKKDVKPIESMLNRMYINFRQEQFDALVSWIYNLGISKFANSTMCKYIGDNRDDMEITDQMIKWVNAGGKPLLGLKRRRVAEANMWHGKKVYGILEGKIVKL